MCRRRSKLLALILLLLTAPARADDVAAFLEQHGLDELLALHLEDTLETATDPEERQPLIARLAALYARLLETVEDPARRVSIEERSRELLSSAPAESAATLRLALLRGSYRSAERVAENHRLRAADPDDVEAATATLTEILPELRRLERQLSDRIEALDRQLVRLGGNEAVRLTERLGETKGLLAQCRFIRAWALYYQSWLAQRRDNAAVAEPLFGRLLDPDNPFLEPGEVSVDLRGIEAISRAVLGMALCKSLTASTPTALAWVALLEHEQVYEAVREQAPAWRLAILLENDEFRAARNLVREFEASGEELPLAWLRLLAVHALERAGRDGDSRELVEFAVEQLASRNELRQILDLAERYGAEALGDSGFALRYIRGVQHYHEARTAHEGDQPTETPSVREMYREASDAFAEALAETDADGYPQAVASARRLIAWCHYFQGRYLEARDAFEAAAAELSDEQGAETLWMAVVCLDQVVRAGAGPERRAELDELIRRFLEAYPASRHTPKLLLRLAAGADEPTEEMVRRLLAIPEHSGVHDEARRRAAHMIYKLFRVAGGEQRDTLASEYLAVAGLILAEDGVGIDRADDETVQAWLVRCRRLLEVALAGGIERRVAARHALDSVETLAAARPELVADFADELEYRRLRFHLLEGEVSEAAAIADALWQGDPASRWSRKANRDMFRAAHDRLQTARLNRDDDFEALGQIVRFGERVIGEYDGDPDEWQRPGVVSYYIAVADACERLLEEKRDETLGRRALEIFRDRLQVVQPDNRRFLRSTGLLAKRFDELELSLDCWRRLVTGSEVDTDPWYEARFNVIWLLARLDPERALEVMTQHRRLHPDYGPVPWGPRLKGLDVRLQEKAGGSTPDAGPPAEETP